MKLLTLTASWYILELPSLMENILTYQQTSY